MKRKLKSFMITATAAMILTMSVSTAAFASEWVKNNTGWWYRYDDNTWPSSTWMKDTDGSWYYFNSDGYMLSSTWLQDKDNSWYYLGGSGAMLANQVTPDGYKLGPTGAWDNQPAVKTQTAGETQTAEETQTTEETQTEYAKYNSGRHSVLVTSYDMDKQILTAVDARFISFSESAQYGIHNMTTEFVVRCSDPTVQTYRVSDKVVIASERDSYGNPIKIGSIDLVNRVNDAPGVPLLKDESKVVYGLIAYISFQEGVISRVDEPFLR